jgi:hypothetical protein
MSDTFVSLYETVDSHFHSIIEGELTYDGSQITIMAPDVLKGITVAAERFLPLKDSDKRTLNRLGIRPRPQIVKGEKIGPLRQYLTSKDTPVRAVA